MGGRGVSYFLKGSREGEYMSNEWIKLKQRHWPTGSLNKFLKADSSSSVVEALKKRIKEDRPAADSIDKLNDHDLALAVAGQIVREMHRLGERRAKREVDREPDSGIPSAPKHPGIQDQEPRDV
jgi:hypothetical protein